MRSRLRLLSLAAFLLAACDEKVLVIESNTAWEGDVTYVGFVEGSGNADLDLTDVPSDVCWTFRKVTSAGILRVYLRDETWFGLGEEIDGDQTTSAPSGEVGGCNQ
jgi:hypothetical protein